MDKLNSIINIDLHIHSSISSYKEENGYVSNSSIENVEILFKRLNDKNISMFAITDHNRFDYELYCKCKEIISLGKYENVKSNLPGIEFDVQIEDGMESCHIICIFNDDNDKALSSISDILNEKLLTKKEQYYTKEEFENILRKIGLSVVLIAHQHKHFDNPNGGKKSVSNSVNNIYEFIKTGYINALEYQNTNVQGMIINSLKKAKSNIATIIGSDCHQWEYYPQKDSFSSNKDYVSKIKSLPNFSGLIFSLTSIDTRFNRVKNDNSCFISGISVNGKDIPLSNGLNAIIGDNGSGKTMLLDILNGDKLTLKDYKNIKEINKIYIKELGNPTKAYIRQNQIIDDVRRGTLFKGESKEYYKGISTKDNFKTRIVNYSKKLLNSINKNINICESRDKLETIELEPLSEKYENVVPIARIDIKVDEENEYESRLEIIQNIYSTMLDEFNDNKKFYNSFKEMKQIIKDMENLIIKISKKSEIKDLEIIIKNSIISHLKTFNSNMNSNKTDKEKEFEIYKTKKNEFIKAISNQMKLELKPILYPDFPKPMPGHTKKIFNGYVFYKSAKYNEINLKENYFSDLFTKNYDELSVRNINSLSILVDALNGITKPEDINNWYKKVESFIEDYTEEETYIERVSTKQPMGKTPGEIAIVFYDFTLKDNALDKNAILIDQPEDDISNYIVSSELINYINENRDKKQIIIVTHNPVLVVNLDVDNVIYLNKDYKNNIQVKNGCLEYKDDNYEIIKEIAEVMDGGLETIRRRFKLYEN